MLTVDDRTSAGKGQSDGGKGNCGRAVAMVAAISRFRGVIVVYDNHHAWFYRL
jgi:hypothetical protein